MKLFELKTKKITFEDIVYFACVAIAFVLLCVNLWTCFFYSIWNDEAYSLGIMNHTYISMISNIAGDVHPPLYYLILKFVADPICAIFSFVPQIFVAKLISMIALVVLFWFAICKLTKVLPKQVVGLFLVGLFCFSSLKDLTTSVRMYSFAALFVIFQFYYFAKIIEFGGIKKDWWMFVLCFELSAYTHNFSLVASGLMFAFLVVYYFFNRRENIKQALKYLLFAALIYVPWFVVLIVQMVQIQSNYWIAEFTFKSLFEVLEYMLIPAGLGLSKVSTIIFVVLISAVYIGVYIFNMISKSIEKDTKWLLSSGYFVTFGLMLFGILFSVIINPIFISRYTNVLFYLFYIAVLLNIYYFAQTLLSKHKVNVKVILFIVCVVLMSFSSIFAIISTENNFVKEYNQNVCYYDNCELIESNDNAIIMLDDINTQTMFDALYSKYGKTYSFGYDKTWWENIQQTSHKQLELDDIKTKIDEGIVILFFAFNENNVTNIEGVGVDVEFLTKTFVGTTKVNVYKISK